MLIRSLIDKKLWLLIVPAASMFMFGGCTYVDRFKEINSTPAIMVIPAEKVQQIDMIELKKASDEESVKPETVEPEKAEYTLSIEECRALTLENNLDLKAELINPTIEKENVNRQRQASMKPPLPVTQVIIEIRPQPIHSW
jgi:regulator of replication initiation timing